MKGSPARQVQIIWEQSGINQIGESRHEKKQEIRAELQKAEKPADSASTNKELGIHSYKTADSYRDVWRATLNNARENFGIRDIEKLTSEAVQGFLLEKIEKGLSASTIKQYTAALQKLEKAVNMHCTNRNWGERVAFKLEELQQEIKAIPRAELEARAFFNPQNVINNLQNEKFKLVAQAQLHGGFRISEINHLQEKNLQGLKKDPISGEEKGKIQIQGKGGKIREIFISKQTYKNLEKAIQNSPNKRFEFNKNIYNRHLKEAGKQAGDRQETSHALRHNFAQNRLNECCQNGKNFEEAKQIVSTEMGHNRPEMTEYYLR